MRSRFGPSRQPGLFRPASPPRSGFTLIEVIGALLIFSFALLLTTGLTASLTVQMRQASVLSELVAAAQGRLDSLAVLPHEAVPEGTTADTVVVQGRSYLFTQDVIEQSPWLREIHVTLAPAAPPGPRYGVVTYLPPPW